MKAVMSDALGGFIVVEGSPVLESLDGAQRAPLATITSASWSEGEREAFGVYLVETTPPAGQRWTGGFTEVAGRPAPVFADIVPTVADVLAERERRLALGFDHDFGDARGVHHIGTAAEDQRGWDEVSKIALARSAAGTTTPIAIVTDTGPCMVTPAEWLAVLETAADFRQPIWQASFILQAMNPIPSNFAENAYWP